MPSGISIVLIAVGAILYFAVSKSVEGLNLSAVGVILMVVGSIGLVMSLIMLGTGRSVRPGGRVTVVEEDAPVR